MGTKLFLFFIGIVIVIGLMWGLSYSEAVDRLTGDLGSVTRSTELAGRQTQTQQEQLDLRIQANSLLETLKTKTAEKESLGSEVRELEAVEPRLAEAMIQAILKVRESSAGMVFPELVLAKGATLKNARIQRLTEESVTFQHSEGVTVARADDLPAELRDRLRLGEAVAKSKAEPVAEPEDPLAKPSPEMAAYNERMKQYRKKGLEMQLVIERLSNEIRSLGSEVYKAENEAESATSATQKFYTRTRRDQLKVQLAALQRTLDEARIELRRHEATPPDAPPRR
ncbi:MAG: hypothetical protein U0984_01405 [Prosthecobacter sp.]|nr:hypothetical protein [Prosthecobacter sp.]